MSVSNIVGSEPTKNGATLKYLLQSLLQPLPLEVLQLRRSYTSVRSPAGGATWGGLGVLSDPTSCAPLMLLGEALISQSSVPQLAVGFLAFTAPEMSCLCILVHEKKDIHLIKA